MRKKVLIVDDNSEYLALLRLNFKAAGFSIATAANGIDALKKARSVAPDLILLDLVLPELDGFAVCESLRHGSSTSSIPVIILTGLASEFSRLAGMECGASAYFTKPVSPKALVASVHGLLDNQPARPRAKKPAKAELLSATN
jgi:two-component system alkaline phosphatase synthesis response regulator PhoP